MARKAATDEPEVEQGFLPEMEQPKNPAIEKAAKAYRKIILERKETQEREGAAHAILLDVMHKEGVSSYTYKGITVVINVKEKCKVKTPEQEADAA